MPIRWHEDAPDDLRESIRFTAEQTGFSPRLIEKDYWCSVILEALAETETPLVFKGGTSLAKIHSGFFRLSEDLDFSISTEPEATRAERQRAVAPIKALVADLRKRVPGLETESSLEGHNESTQYNATVGYRSLLGSATETISIEIGLREPILNPPEPGLVRTAALHWSGGGLLVDAFPVRCLAWSEAMAEKLRAALSRREAAIRDYFDIDHAVRVAGLDLADPELLQLLRRKLAVRGTGAIDVSLERLGRLRAQLDAHLRPVLRDRELAQFDLDRAFAIVRGVADRLGDPR